MPPVDKFEPVNKFRLESGAGFVRAYDERAARRQLQVSLGLVLVLGLAAMTLGILTQLDRPGRAIWPSAIEAGGLPLAQAFPERGS